MHGKAAYFCCFYLLLFSAEFMRLEMREGVAHLNTNSFPFSRRTLTRQINWQNFI